MKVLLDTCVWGGACKDLQAAGYDVVLQAGAIIIALLGRLRIRLPDED